jgi:hypothetical protein
MRSYKLALIFATVVSSAFLVACSSASPNATAMPPGLEIPSTSRTSNAQTTARGVADHVGSKQFIYVSQYDYPYEVNVFSKARPYGLVRTITDDVDSPYSLALDAKGDLFVTDQNTVEEYANGGSIPTFTYSTDLAGPDGLSCSAVDSSGDVYVCDDSDDEIVVFPPQQNSPSRFISLPGAPYGVAVDSHDDLYVGWDETSYGAQVYEYAPGSSSPKNLNLRIAGSVILGMALDSYGNIALSEGNTAQLALYPSGSQDPTVTIRYPYAIGEVAIDPEQNKLYLTTGPNASQVQIYDYNADQLSLRKVGSLRCPYQGCVGVAAGP